MAGALALSWHNCCPLTRGCSQLQGLTSVEQLLEEMDNILVELSGESDQTGR